MEREFETPELCAGFRIGEYILRDKVGEGGFGEVWKAEHHFLKDHFVALKILKPEFSSEMLEQEAHLQFQLQNILKEKDLEKGMVKIQGGDPHHQPPYLICEYISPDFRGRTSLRDYLKDRQKLDPSLALDFFWQIVRTLSVAHSGGLIHGDLKPENLLIEKGDGVKLADFGLGKTFPLDKENLSRSLKVSKEHNLFGTLAYMAPEQKRGEVPSAASDMYSLGIILYEMVVGELPQGGEMPSQMVSGLPEEIDVLFKKTYNHRDLRYQNARELEREEELRRAQEEKISLRMEVQVESQKVPPTPLSSRKENKKEVLPCGRPAGFGVRLFATIVDLVTLCLAYSALVPAFGPATRGSAAFSFFIFASLYYIFATCILGGTLGKLSLGLKVVDQEGKKLTLGASFSRWMGYFFSFFLFGFGFYMVLFHPERRGLHDFFGSSRVIYDE